MNSASVIKVRLHLTSGPTEHISARVHLHLKQQREVDFLPCQPWRPSACFSQLQSPRACTQIARKRNLWPTLEALCASPFQELLLKGTPSCRVRGMRPVNITRRQPENAFQRGRPETCQHFKTTQGQSQVWSSLRSHPRLILANTE
jgi:hypothetical protein